MVDMNREIQESKVRLCLDCGKCTSVCPVTECDPDFNPRLIVKRRLGADNLRLKDETIWSCVGCYMCVERCNYRVQFPEFICALREEARDGGFQVQCSHGGTLQSLMHMMAHNDLRQDRLHWLPDDIQVSQEGDTLFFVGCAPYFDIIFSDLKVELLEGVGGALRLLNLAEIPFTLLENERCCGHDLLMQGDREGFIALASANMAEFAYHGIKRIITHCSEGYYTLKFLYPKMLGSRGIEVLHLTEILAHKIEIGKLKLGTFKKRITYHDDCRLGRCSRLFEEPRVLLKTTPGIVLVEMENNRMNSRCCGANPWAHCGAINRQIQERRIAQAAATGAEIMVTTCPKCKIHLKCAQKTGSNRVSQIEIQDLWSVLGLSVAKEVRNCLSSDRG